MSRPIFACPFLHFFAFLHPEIDRAEFFDVTDAKRKINPAQVPLSDELVDKIAAK